MERNVSVQEITMPQCTLTFQTPTVVERELFQDVFSRFCVKQFDSTAQNPDLSAIHHIRAKRSPECHKALLSQTASNLTDAPRNEREQMLQEVFFKSDRKSLKKRTEAV